MENYPGLNFEVIRFTTLDTIIASTQDNYGEEVVGE